MNKKRWLLLIFLLVPLLFIGGFSAWIISTSHNVAPSYDENHSLAMYFEEDSLYEYNTNNQAPKIKQEILNTEGFDGESFIESLYFAYAEINENGNFVNGSTYTSGLPVDAARYSIKIAYNSETAETKPLYTTLRINPTNIISLVGNPKINDIYQGDFASFDDSGVYALGVANENISGKCSYTNTEGTKTCVYNGTGSTSSNTVSMTFTPTSKNYLPYVFDANFTMKPIAYISKNYYGTIESALNAANGSNNDIVFVIPGTKTNYHNKNNAVVPDKVEYTIKGNCEIKAGVTLVIPTDSTTIKNVTSTSTLETYIKSMKSDDGSRGETDTYKSFATSNQNYYLRTTINIADDVTLINNGTLVVSGYLSPGNSNAGTLGHTSHSYSRILLGQNSKILQQNNSAVIHCYGYISEKTQNNNSLTKIEKGSLYVPFVVNDYRGFHHSWAMTDGAIDVERSAPFNQFEFRNIDSTVEILYNGKVYGIVNIHVLYTSVSVDERFNQTINLIGSADGFVIKLTESTYSKVIHKYNTLTSVSKIDIYGGMKMNNLKIKLSKSIVNIDLSTTNAYFPISYRFNIDLYAAEGQSNASFDLSLQRIKVLPGASFTINENCTVDANDVIVYTAFYDGALGSGESSGNGYDSVKYPLKEGAILKLNGNSLLKAKGLAGTIYGTNDNVTYTSNTIVSKEAWHLVGTGEISPAWTIDDYLEIHEILSIQPLDYLTSKEKLYIGMNTFTKANTYTPEINVLLNDKSETANVNTYQKVIMLDDIVNYEIEFVKNVYTSYCSTTRYAKHQVVTYNSNTSIFGAINSVLSISNNANGVNEFDVQKVEIECKTPLVNGEIPLFVDTTINLEATVTDIDKAYNKTITWSSLNPSIAKVNSSGAVTGVSVGTTTIQAMCDGVIGTFEVNVLEEVQIESIESINITDNKGNSSDVVYTVKNDVEYHGSYSKGNTATFTVNINPSTAPYASIVWVLHKSDGSTNRHYISDTTVNVETIDDNRKSVTVTFAGGTGASDDIPSLTCKVTDLNGNVFTEVFRMIHKADQCLAEGTLITMADGSQKKVEDLQVGDMLLVFNHETGQFDYVPLLVNVHGNQEAEYTNVMNLYFDNGTILRIISDHGLFDIDYNKYVYIDETNYSEFIGHSFVSTNIVDGQYVTSSTKLTNVEITNEYIKVFNPASVWHLNVIAYGMLTLSSGMVNFFEYDSSYKYDEESMKKDLEKYGEYTYEDFKDYVPIEVFNAFPFKYFKVAVGKGLITYEEILELIKHYYNSV